MPRVETKTFNNILEYGIWEAIITKAAAMFNEQDSHNM